VPGGLYEEQEGFGRDVIGGECQIAASVGGCWIPRWMRLRHVSETFPAAQPGVIRSLRSLRLTVKVKMSRVQHPDC
jgi:hypothetical protein